MKLFTAALTALLLSTAAHARSDAPVGVWLNDQRDTKVRVVECGNNLCATVVWLGKPISPETGKPKTDVNNPDPAKRSRPLIGLTVMSGMKPNGDNKWSGSIYNADDGKTYSAHIEPQSGSVIKVAGCVLGVLCKTTTWTKSDDRASR